MVANPIQVEIDKIIGKEDVAMRMADQYAALRNEGTPHREICTILLDLADQSTRPLFRSLFGEEAEREAPDDVAIVTTTRTRAAEMLDGAGRAADARRVANYPVREESMLTVAALGDRLELCSVRTMFV